MLNTLDKDGDGELNMSEFVNFIAVSCMERQPIPKLHVCRFAKFSMSRKEGKFVLSTAVQFQVTRWTVAADSLVAQGIVTRQPAGENFIGRK